MKRPGVHKGAVLLTVLLLVTVMAGVAVWLTDAARFGIHRTVNLRDATQARWYALGAEALARQGLYTAWQADPGRTPPQGPWQGAPLEYPIEGGRILARLSDATTCFNLNAVVDRKVGTDLYITREDGVAAFARLVTAVANVPPAEATRLAAALADYIDSDNVAGPSGAEDYAYAIALPPYHTADGLIAHVSELRAVRGVTAELYGALLPHVCAVPQAGPLNINVNLLTEADAPLIQALVGTGLTVDRAADAIRRRPAGGWEAAGDFWAQDMFAGLGVSVQISDQTGVRSDAFVLQVETEYGGAFVRLTSVLAVSSSGVLRVLSRSFGEFQ